MDKLNQVSGRRFLKASLEVQKVWKLMQDNVTLPPNMDATFYMDANATMGYGVGSDGELRALWSLVRGQGERLVKEAIENGATWVSCYDNGYLVQFYQRCGLDITLREKNWVEGQPDVVRLAWRT